MYYSLYYFLRATPCCRGYICQSHLVSSQFHAIPNAYFLCHGSMSSYRNISSVIFLHHTPDPDPLGALFPAPTPAARLLGVLPPELFLFLLSSGVQFPSPPLYPLPPASLSFSLRISISFPRSRSFACCSCTLSATELWFFGLYHPSLVNIVPGCSVASSSESYANDSGHSIVSSSCGSPASSRWKYNLVWAKLYNSH
jgi:hypothetical protein